jgi:hypothetical protein
MTPELQNKLAELADKLGVSVEHLWGVLVRQAYIDGIATLGGSLLLLILLWLAAANAKKVLRKCKNAIDSARLGELDEIAQIILVVLVGAAIVGGGIASIFVIVNLPLWIISAIGKLLNPEYYALMDLKGFL